MPAYSYRGWRKTMGIYLVVGAVGLFAYSVWQAGLQQMFSGAGGITALTVTAFYLAAGFLSAVRPLTRMADGTLRLALLLQATGFSLYGLFFRCAFAPVLGISFSTVTRSPVTLETRIFAFGISAGYEPGVDAVTITLNLLPFLLLLLLVFRGRKS